MPIPGREPSRSSSYRQQRQQDKVTCSYCVARKSSHCVRGPLGCPTNRVPTYSSATWPTSCSVRSSADRHPAEPGRLSNLRTRLWYRIGSAICIFCRHLFRPAALLPASSPHPPSRVQSTCQTSFILTQDLTHELCGARVASHQTSEFIVEHEAALQCFDTLNNTANKVAAFASQPLILSSPATSVKLDRR